MRAKPAISKQMQGFTLIELIVGMTVMIVVIGLMMSALVPREKQSVEQINIIRATHLAQSLMQEITSNAFDQQSVVNGDKQRCNETGSRACTGYLALGSEPTEQRSNFNDVDDYHGLTSFDGFFIDNGTNQFNGFLLRVNVSYDNNYNGVFDVNNDDYSGQQITNSTLSKLITVTVTTPLGTPVTLSSYKANI